MGLSSLDKEPQVSPPGLQLQGVAVRLSGGYLFRSVRFALPPGSATVIVGPSGAGKTTLLRLLQGLQNPHEGEALVEGKTWPSLSPAERLSLMRMLGYVQQQMGLLRTTVLANVALPLRWRGLARERAEARAMEILDLLELRPLAQRPPRALSGGERQRVVLARALAPRPRVLLLDEFTNHQDPVGEQTMENLVMERHRAGATLLLVGHGLDQAARVRPQCPGGLQLAALVKGRLDALRWDDLPSRAKSADGAGPYLRRLIDQPPWEDKDSSDAAAW